jgi:hypothetical protein
MDVKKTDEQGYLIPANFVPGVLFPRPSGKFKPIQILYNWLYNYDMSTAVGLYALQGYNKKLQKDWDASNDTWGIGVAGRVHEPKDDKGWLDGRAKKRGEYSAYVMRWLSPQDSNGNVISNITYLDPSDSTQTFLYFNQLRRIRKLSAEDTQDPFLGADFIIDDGFGFSQKLSPQRFPYKYEIIAEREYLVPTYTWDGSAYYTSKELELRDAEFERRPVYVIQMIQQDPNYVYSKRLIYVDKETFHIIYIENYDRKGRLYRNCENMYVFYPDQGMFNWFKNIAQDHLDMHSTLLHPHYDPFALWVTREHCSIGRLTKIGK